MRWPLFVCLFHVMKLIDAGALKCSPGSRDPSCATEKKEILSFENLLEGAVDSSVEAECLPFSEWESNCHSCRCDGRGIAHCSRQEHCEVTGDPIRCKPNTSFRRGCNTCTCLENGNALCTLRLCLEREKRNFDYAGECVPGSTVRIDCNTCHCSANGRLACTKIGCLHLPHNERTKRSSSDTYYAAYNFGKHSVNKRAVCKPSQEFQVDCNPCKCAANGLSYTCTHEECLEGDVNKEVEVFMESEGSDHIESHSVCKPGDTFNIVCNTCHCNIYGTDYSCTNKACPPPKDVEVFQELINTHEKEKTTSDAKVVCVANRMFIKDCNTCWCNENGTSYYCTRRVCIEKPDEIPEDPNEELKLRLFEKRCEPNQVFAIDCNMCRCEPDGLSYGCTRRACEESETTSLSRKTRGTTEPAKACQPGQEFRLDCNKCLCNDEGQDFSCTRIDCTALNSNGGVATFTGPRTKRDLTEQIELECVPGSVFDRECNVCRCTSDGRHASCSLKRCQKEKPATEVTTESSPSFRCTPGDQFKRDCNDCTCSADGKNVFCTLRLCD